jgi:hypothetical protein
MRLKRGKCPSGHVDLSDAFRVQDATWSSGQPGGPLSEAHDLTGRLRILQDRADQRAKTEAERERLTDVLGRVTDLDLNFRHTGPELVGNDYTLRLCARVRPRQAARRSGG